MRPCLELLEVPHHQRLRPTPARRLGVEEQLIADATERGWAREVERHETTRGRLQARLNELGDPEPQVARAA